MTLNQGGAGCNTAPANGYEPTLAKEAKGFKGSEAKQFLELLGKDTASTWLRALDPLKVRKTGIDHHPEKSWFSSKTSDGFNLYAVIGNAEAIKGSNAKDEDITGVPAFFVEWDDGADIETQAQRWQALELPEPTVMVSTGGKSVHCYWVLREPLEPVQWRAITARLIAHCKGDPACKNPSRLMRLPGSVYFDKKTGEPTGECRIIAATGARYAVFDIETALPAPAPLKPVTAAPKGEWEPRSSDEISAAAEYIPPRTPGQGTYEQDLHALCGCSAALAEAGVADPDNAALALLGHLWPTEADARQVLDTTTTREAKSFWAIAGEHGYDLKRSKTKARRVVQTPAKTTTDQGVTPGTGNGVRLRPNQVLALLPDRVGTLRLNVRSQDVHTDDGILTANDAAHLYLKLSNSGETWCKNTTADAVAYLANQNRFDPVADYLNDTGTALPMEQWQRLDHHLLGIDDDIAAEFLPRYLIGAVARVFEPGCDVRQTPVLVGPQWRGKTALGRILFGDDHFVSGIGDLGKDALMRLHTAWGAELAELDGVTRRSDQESLKAFLTETVDSIRRPYDVATVRHPRKFVFWGTSNGAALRDTTGNTRYVTIPIPDRMLPLEWVQRHRNALWARAVEQYRAGVQWNQCSDAIRLAIADRNDNFTEQDPWGERIAQALKRRALELQLPVLVSELLAAVEVPVDRRRGADGQRVRRIAESLGWVMERRGNRDDRRRGLWPAVAQVAQAVAQAVAQDETSHCNDFDPRGLSGTTKPKELEKREREQQQEHPQQQREQTFGAHLVPLVPPQANTSDTNGSEPERLRPPLVPPSAQLVPPVSSGYIKTTIPGFVDTTPAPTGSGWDTEAA